MNQSYPSGLTEPDGVKCSVFRWAKLTETQHQKKTAFCEIYATFELACHLKFQ